MFGALSLKRSTKEEKMCWKGTLGRPTKPRHSSDSSPQRWMCLASSPDMPLWLYGHFGMSAAWGFKFEANRTWEYLSGSHLPHHASRILREAFEKSSKKMLLPFNITKHPLSKSCPELVMLVARDHHQWGFPHHHPTFFRNSPNSKRKHHNWSINFQSSNYV